ncbi:MAG: undecaprenyl-diphosphate phosphatase [Olsenella sp.]|nr:undecaprenyl-diphosphate phosphatase [Olsenella sp.]
MNLVELLKAALFGLVEGITEWLPVSSTGHMLLLGQFMKLDVTEQFWNMFLVVIQLGAILAVLVLFFHELNPFSRAKTPEERRGTWTLWGKIVLACVPAAVVGLPLDDWMTEHLEGPFVVAAALVAYGVAFIVIERVRAGRARALTSSGGAHFALPEVAEGASATVLADEEAPVQEISELGWGRALGIGLFQVLSLVPGTSRSGSTIIGGLLLGCSRTVASEFTFYLAIPVMFGASALKLVKYLLAGGVPTATEGMTLLVGCVVAFLVSIAAIRFLMGFVRKHSFESFGWYRIVLGALVVAYFALLA